MLRRSYKIATERLDNIHWTLLLSCIIKEQMLRCRWQIYLEIKDIDRVEIHVWIVSLFLTKVIKEELDYVAHLIGKLQEKIDYQCDKYQNWKTILESEGSSFLEERERCIATGCETFDKFKPAQRFFTVPADLFDTVFTHEIDFFRRLKGNLDYGSIDKNIIPLVTGINALPFTATVSSCQGHFTWPDNRCPFVCFISNIDTIKSVYRIINTADLNLKWTLAGMVENGCPSLGPYIIWKLLIGEKLTVFNIKRCRQDIARLYSLFKAKAAQLTPGTDTWREGKYVW